MSERFNWFNKGREKQKLMSQVLERASDAVEDLKERNFMYRDSEDQMRMKKEFDWSEFVSKEDIDAKRLDKADVLEALGMGPNPRIEDAPRGKELPGQEVRGIWPTFVPDLYYVRVRNLRTTLEDDYFLIEEGAGGATEPQSQNQPVAEESLSDWNKRQWSQSDADKKASEELNETGEKIKKETDR